VSGKDATLPRGRICRVASCGKLVGRAWSPFCYRHRNALRRWGHPEAGHIPPREIRARELAITRGIRRLSPDLQANLEQRMARAVGILAEFCAGLLAPGAETDTLARIAANRRAATFLLRCITNPQVPARDLVIGTAAHCILARERPDLFPADRVITTSILRFLAKRGGGASSLVWFPIRREYVKRIKRDLPRDVQDTAGAWWIECTAPLVVLLRQVATRHERFQLEEARKRRELSREIEAPSPKPKRKEKRRK
jgi:hypothetical protein